MELNDDGFKMQGKNGLFTPTTYSHIYKLSTVQIIADKGTWTQLGCVKVGPVEQKDLYDMAKNFAVSVGKGGGSDNQEVKTSLDL